MKQSIKFYLFFVLSYQANRLECGFNQIPKNNIVDNNHFSYLALDIYSDQIQSQLIVPKGYGVVREFIDLDDQQYSQNQIINKQEERSIQMLSFDDETRKRKYDYINSYMFQFSQKEIVSVDSIQQNIAIQVLIFGKDYSIKFMKVFYLNIQQQDYCFYGLELQTIMSSAKNFTTKIYRITETLFIVNIYHTKSFSRNHDFQIMLLPDQYNNFEFQIFKLFDKRTNLYGIQQNDIQLNNVQNIDIEEFNYKGVKQNQFSQNIDQNNGQAIDYIPRISIVDQTKYFNYEFIRSNNQIKFFQIEINKQLGFQPKTIGYHIQIDFQTIKVLAVNNLQNQIKNIYYNQQEHGITSFSKIREAEIQYIYIQDRFATTDKFVFKPDFQNEQILDSHLLFHEHELYDQQAILNEQYQLLVAFKYQNNKIEIQITLGPQKLMKKKIKYLKEKKQFQVNFPLSHQIDQKNQNLSNSQNTFTYNRLNYFYNQLQHFCNNPQLLQSLQQSLNDIASVSKSQNSIHQNSNLKLIQLDFPEDQEVEEQQDYQLIFNKQENKFHLQIVGNEAMQQTCYVSSVYVREILDNLKNKAISIIFDKNIEENLNVTFESETQESIVFDINFAYFHELFQEKNLQFQFCFVKIQEEKIFLFFEDIVNGYILQQKQYKDFSKKTISLRQHLFFIQNRKLQHSRYVNLNLNNVIFQNIYKYQYLIQETGDIQNKEIMGTEFCDLSTDDEKIFKSSVNSDDLSDNSILPIVHSFSLNDQNGKTTIITRISTFSQSINHSTIYSLINEKNQQIIFSYDFNINISSVPKTFYIGQINQKQLNIIQEKQEIQKVEILRPVQILAQSIEQKLDFYVGKNKSEEQYIYIYPRSNFENLYILNIYYQPYKQSKGFLCMSTEVTGDPVRFIVQLVRVDNRQKNIQSFEEIQDDINSKNIIVSTKSYFINQHKIDMKIGYSQTPESKKQKNYEYVFEGQLDFQYLFRFYTYIVNIPNLDLEKIDIIKNKVKKIDKTQNILQGNLIFDVQQKNIIL